MLQAALSDSGLVQSFSGVRTVFGMGPDVSYAHKALAFAYGFCYAKRVATASHSVQLLGRDPRPTGSAIARQLVAGFLAGAKRAGSEVELIDLGIITTPLAETAMRALEADGGVMVTASHNPLQHNGFKFFTGCRRKQGSFAAPPGALLSAEGMSAVIEDVSLLARNRDFDIRAEMTSVSELVVNNTLAHPERETSRVRAERAYLDSIGADWGIAPHCLKPFTLGPVLVDPNGGAGCGIDARVLEHFGVRVIEINAELGYPEHGIDTDGIDPAGGRHMLLRVARAAARERAHFGVAFDYDADRGNIVLPGHDESAIIPPQRAAGFNIAVALARRSQTEARNRRLAVVMSDATSLANERIAVAFGADVFYVETGEINVVTRMHQLREEGFDVPVGVEGANGGTIFETSTCRDGLQVALSAAVAESQPELRIALARAAIAAGICVTGPPENLTLKEMIAAIPLNSNSFIRLTSPTISQSELKSNIEAYFVDRIWQKLNTKFACYEFQNFEGARQCEVRTGEESGGWRVLLSANERRAFVFLRGSKTEAGVWRMVVDADNLNDFGLVLECAQEMFHSA